MTDFAYLTVRNLPKPLHAALTKLAAANRRSVNAEVVMAIEEHIIEDHARKFGIEPHEIERTPTKRAKGKR